MIKYVKIISGEEFIADILEETETTYVCENPTIFFQDKEGMKAAPVAILAKDNKISVLKTAVIFTAEPGDQMVEVYSQMHGKIVTASNIWTS